MLSINLRRGGRLCPPMRTCEFADGLRISAARFAGRTESSAPTAFEKFSRFCVGGDAHIDPRAIADSHWIFAKTAHTAGAMCSIAPYEHPGRICQHPGRIPRRNSPNKKILPSRALGREYRNTSWCHPNLKSLLFLVCRAFGAATGDFGTSLIRPLGGCPSRTLAAEIFQLVISSLSGRLAVLLPRPCGSVLFR